MVAQLTLDQLVKVRILVPQFFCVYDFSEKHTRININRKFRPVYNMLKTQAL